MVGTRPEAIKLAPVAHALKGRGLSPLLILTGQQPIDCAQYGLNGFDRVALDCPGQRNPHRHVAQVAAALTNQFEASAPRLLVVQGDTSSAFGSARAAFASGLAVAHVEAGLRTHDPRQPWPEEEYRVAIDAQAELLFAPTQGAATNLRAERVPGAIHVTGNTGVDALRGVLDRLPAPRPGKANAPRILVTCHRRESWGRGLASIARALTKVVERKLGHVELILHPNPHVSRAMQRKLEGVPNIEMVEPCSYSELVQRMRDADLILSDSGGIQEEAPTVGTPLLILRDKTERPEGILSGNARLVGTKSEAILNEVERLLTNSRALRAMSSPAFPYGDGRAAPRIAEIIDGWLKALVTPTGLEPVFSP